MPSGKLASHTPAEEFCFKDLVFVVHVVVHFRLVVISQGLHHVMFCVGDVPVVVGHWSDFVAVAVSCLQPVDRLLPLQAECDDLAHRVDHCGRQTLQ